MDIGLKAIARGIDRVQVHHGPNTTLQRRDLLRRERRDALSHIGRQGRHSRERWAYHADDPCDSHAVVVQCIPVDSELKVLSGGHAINESGPIADRVAVAALDFDAGRRSIGPSTLTSTGALGSRARGGPNERRPGRA